jgi:hypothetical protein
MNENIKKMKKGGPAPKPSGGGKSSSSSSSSSSSKPTNRIVAAAKDLQNAKTNANISASYAAKAKAVQSGKQVTGTSTGKSNFTYQSGNAPAKPKSNFTYQSGNAQNNSKYVAPSKGPSTSKVQQQKHKKVLTSETNQEDPIPFGGGTISFTSMPTTSSQDSPSIRIPEKDNVLSLTNNDLEVAEITALVFEKLGAVELTKFTRTDTVEGNNPYYNIISNLSSIKKEFDPTNLISAQKSDTSLYNAFSIKLSNKIPGEAYLLEKSLPNYIFIDEDGNLIIELDNMTPDELVEIEIDTNGTIVEVNE